MKDKGIEILKKIAKKEYEITLLNIEYSRVTASKEQNNNKESTKIGFKL